MPTCPKCGAELVISHPLGPSTWQENCPACGYEGGGTVYLPIDELLDEKTS